MKKNASNQLINQPFNSISYEEACRCYLTNAEIRVVKFVALGFSSKQIAGKLGNSPSTIQTHRRNIKKKLNLNGHRSLERWCGEQIEEILKEMDNAGRINDK